MALEYENEILFSKLKMNHFIGFTWYPDKYPNRNFQNFNLFLLNVIKCQFSALVVPALGKADNKTHI